MKRSLGTADTPPPKCKKEASEELQEEQHTQQMHQGAKSQQVLIKLRGLNFYDNKKANNRKVAEGDICQLKRDLQWEQVYRPKMNQASFQVLNDHGQVCGKVAEEDEVALGQLLKLRYRVNDDRPAGAAFTWRYAELRMIKCQNKALDNLRDGLLDVIPARGLEGLTAEDLRLLLNGVGDINVSTLISYTSFNDESGETPDRLVSFKRWLWAVIEKMSSMEKQDLVYFWTGSPALPASEEGFQPMPSVTIGVQLAIKKSPWVGGGSK